MSILESMLSAGNGDIVNQLAGRFGISAEHATSAVSALVPLVAGGMKEKLANNDTGLASVLSGEKMSEFAGDLSSVQSPGGVNIGNDLLSRLFSSTETSNIISTVAEKVGISGDTVGKLLPIVATFVGGFASKSAASGGSLTDTIGELADVGSGGIMGAVKAFASKVLG